MKAANHTGFCSGHKGFKRKPSPSGDDDAAVLHGKKSRVPKKKGVKEDGVPVALPFFSRGVADA
jgi:hypothetical protein